MKFSDVRDGSDWLNPGLVIRADGIGVISRRLKTEFSVIPVTELRGWLTSLPPEAWPYGRVAAVSENSLRIPGPEYEEAIRLNRQEVEAVLDALDVSIDWWPS